MMVSNKWHNLQNKIVQFTGQKKAWIGTIAILKGLKYKLSFWTSLKSKTQLIQLTDRKTGMLKCWNVGIELSICGTTKSPPIYTLPQFLSMSENNCGIYWLDSFNSLTSHNSLKSSKQFTVSVSRFLLGDSFHSQILKRGKFNLSSCINLVITRYELQSQYVKLTQLWSLTVNCVLNLIWQDYHKIIKNLFPLHICRPNDHTAEI